MQIRRRKESEPLTRDGGSIDESKSLLGAHDHFLNSVQLERLGGEHDLRLATDGGDDLDVGVTGDGASDVGELLWGSEEVRNGSRSPYDVHSQVRGHHWPRWSREEGQEE